MLSWSRARKRVSRLMGFFSGQTEIYGVKGGARGRASLQEMRERVIFAE